MTVAANHAIGDIASGDGTHLADPESLANLGVALDVFLVYRIQQPGHGQLHLVDQLIDDAVKADLHLLSIRRGLGVSLRLHVEAYNDPFRSRRKVHIRLGDGADAGKQNPNANLVVRKLLQSV